MCYEFCCLNFFALQYSHLKNMDNSTYLKVSLRLNELELTIYYSAFLKGIT